jgi:phospholipase/carboxylesterase
MPNLHSKLFTYRYVPAKIGHPDERVVVVLHGLGDSMAGYGWFPGELGIDDLSFLLVNAPDSYYGGYSWYDFLEDPKPGIIRSRRLLFGLIDELMQQGIASENIFLFGFSQGCLMALDVGLRIPLALGGICGVSGYLGFEEEYPDQFSIFGREQEMLLTHGTQDPVVPFANSKRQYQKLKDMGARITFMTYPKDHTILPQELVDIAGWFRLRLSRPRVSS